MSSPVPVFVYVARPTTKARLSGLFEHGPVRAVLENPGTLRYAGWNMETQEQARIIKGEYLEIALADWKTIQLYEDGMLLAKVKADEDFLAWGSRGHFEQRPRLNPLALIEFTYSFVDVFSRVLPFAEPQPAMCVLNVNIQNAFRSQERLYLNPYHLESVAHLMDQTRYRAPQNTDELEVHVEAALVRERPARAAYLFVERIYLWFGVPPDQIPYTSGTGNEKVIDVEALRRGGKPQ